MTSFSIITVSWNALHHLQKFLPTVCRTTHPRFEIILVDNASTDESADWVKKNYPDVRIVTLDKNYGYCGGNNRGAKHARYNTLVFLNNDVAVDPNWLIPVDDMLAKNPEIAAIQPKIRSFNQPDHFEYAGAAGGYIDTMGFPFCRGRIFGTLEHDRGQYNTPSPIFWASGAALVIRKDIFEHLDGFYEPFEFHMEEIDLCWRVQLSGKQIWYCPDSVVYHLGGGSLAAGNPRKTFYNFRNNLIMMARNLPDRWRFFIIFNRLELDGLAGIQFLMKGQLKNMWAIIRAHFAFYGHLSQIKSWRKTQNRSNFKPLKELQGVLKSSIIANYYLIGRKTWNKVSHIISK
jgi:GT2 family glycosyltransferase